MTYNSLGARWFTTSALVFSLLGCGSRDDNLETAPIVARAALGQELLFVDRTNGIVHAVNVMNETLSSTATRIDIPANPLLAKERPGTQEVLVVCGGKRDENDEWIEAPALAVIDRGHEVRRYNLKMPLSGLTTTQDGRYALLYAPSVDSKAGELLNNPNRVALVDLNAAPSSSNPVERVLKAPGGTLKTVYLTKPMNVVGEQRPMALFTFGNGISVWDLSHPERAEITSEGLASNSSVTLKTIVEDDENGTLYFIQDGLTDLRVLELDNVVTGKENDFWPSWNQLPLDSSSATDLVLYQEQGEPRVLVAVGSQVRIIDSNDSRVIPINVSKNVSKLYGFEGTSPNDSEAKPRVLGWAPGTSAVTFIEFQELESRGTRNMEVLELGGSISELLSLSDTKVLAKFTFGGIGVLDLESRRFTPLTASVELTAPLIESDGERVWVGATGDVKVGYLKPNTLETGDVRLDSTIQEMFIFENDDNRRVVVSHAAAWGKITVVEAEQPTRSTAKVLNGFLLDGLVKR